jgi:hypothetical protein
VQFPRILLYFVFMSLVSAPGVGADEPEPLPTEHPSEPTATGPALGGTAGGGEISSAASRESDPGAEERVDVPTLHASIPSPNPSQEPVSRAPDPPATDAAAAPPSPVADPIARASAPVPAASGASPARWILPFEIGQRWTYVFVRERSRSMAGAENEAEARAEVEIESEVEKQRGTLTVEIAAPAPEYGEGVVRMHSILQVSEFGSTGAEPEESESFVRNGSEGIALVAEEMNNPVEGKSRLTRYPVPLRMLDAGASADEPWSVGVREQGGMKTELAGRILGVQDVQTPRGLFERCLVVRLEGAVSGVVEAHGSRTEIPDGRYTSTEWYAPGVGRVLVKQEISQTLVLEDGSEVLYSERIQFALRETTATVPAAPEPDPDPPVTASDL